MIVLWVLLAYVLIGVFISVPCAARLFIGHGFRESNPPYGEFTRKQAAVAWSIIWPFFWISVLIICVWYVVTNNKSLSNYFFGRP